MADLTDKSPGITPSEKPKKPLPPGAAGHRRRMYRRLLENGPDGIKDHRLLEMLLYSAIPRIDTRDLAVSLIDRFGSLSGVFAADPDELCSVEGIGESSAALIKLVSGLHGRLNSPTQTKQLRCGSTESLGELFMRSFTGVKSECVYLAGFTPNHTLLRLCGYPAASPSSCVISWRSISDFIHITGAAEVAIAHNHPGGELLPSQSDLAFTRELRRFLDKLGVGFRGHLICGDHSYLLIMADEL